jgi:hypothetical protein
MSADEHTPEDIAGLFGKFGGDAHGYREFAPPEAEAEVPRVWPLLSGEKIAHPPVAPVQAPPPAPAPAPVFAPAPPPAPVYAPAPAPAPAPFFSPAAAPQARIDPVLRAAAPAAFAPAPVFAPPPAPVLAPAVPLGAPASSDSAAVPPTPLEQLFERLASPHKPAAAPGPMSRWRRPT